ncbi:hypothetical protein BGM19_36460 [Streptomyces agglomeratus]|uniref:Uncharacterized protein n=1 Tax=Streptomyces agglomeratus TaxID=285458 RepID=A0A1E5NXZ5_9ACTN|nr:hypothetical protein AS594_36700 [Streptomyces agglomeratus]OEJ23177.1 hypothetical protein AS594_00190 [Streptomyces agglomeratus]OEJ56297.1 hypothetical protein BGM19_36760 [Streptomyces agglomeratus]OEJ62652.1 hypothetical protein BGM19_36460 [Streptomyces agglomeratus]
MTMPTDTVDRGMERRLASAVWLVRQYIAQHCSPGGPLPSARSLAHHLSVPYRTLKAALVHLDGIGEVVWGMHQRGEVLAPGDVHPDDVDLLREVQARISAGIYHRGQAMPTSILAVAHGIQPKCIPRAFRHLVADGTLHHDEHGPHGPGYYVSAQPLPLP